jgi:excisionase family DNA binding protein
MSGSSRITNRHLERSAAVYVRQSTQNQVLKNRESRQRQYGLADRARELGWPDERILIIDSDLGQSATSQGTRSGFRQLCEQVSQGRVGAIFGIEVSRLARNTVEWFQLLDLCRLNDTMLVEDSQVYAPGREDDGLILGIKGTFSAAELSVLRARMEGGRRSKAQRGELYSSPPVGFVREGNGLRKDPDLRVQAALEAVFARFREGGSGLQATHLLREAGVQLPSRPHGAAGLTWREAAYSRVMDIVKNPAMGGAYAYGKSRHAYRDDGTLLAPEERWRVLKPGRHDGYVSWPEWLEVQETLAANSTIRERNRGAAREGAALLQGLAVCGHCGRSLLVRYNKGRSYYCNQRTPDLGQRRSCFSVGGIEIDRVVARRFLDLVSPGGVEAARAAAQAVAERAETAFRSQRLELEQCRYEAGLAERRYRQVDPDNRLIAATLEREWEAALKAVESAQFALETARERRPDPPPPSFFAGLGSSLERVWDAPETTHRDRKRLLACLVEEVALQVDGEGQTEVVIHWRGGRTDAVSVKRQPRRPVRRRDDLDTVELVRRLARFYPDGQIAGILNDQGRRSAQGLPFSTSLVHKLRYRHGVPGYRAAAHEEEGELLSVRAAARQLEISDSTLYRWVNSGILPSVRPDVPGAPVRIRMGAGFRSRFHLDPPQGFVPLREAMRRLGVSRQTIWQRAASGQLESCHVKRGGVRGLYVRLETDELPLFEGTLPAQHEHGDA